MTIDHSHILLPTVAEKPRLHRRGLAHARAGHRGEYGDLWRLERTPVQAASRQESRLACGIGARGRSWRTIRTKHLLSDLSGLRRTQPCLIRDDRLRAAVHSRQND